MSMDARTPNLEVAAAMRGWRPERCDRVALVLQGGGALGAYQAGVYQALHEAQIEPDWVCGVSIGAINSAIIAGNPPERRLERLHTFW
jgi:NTE family protein